MIPRILVEINLIEKQPIKQRITKTQLSALSLKLIHTGYKVYCFAVCSFLFQDDDIKWFSKALRALERTEYISIH